MPHLLAHFSLFKTFIGFFQEQGGTNQIRAAQAGE
jgi:hypothetical protein